MNSPVSMDKTCVQEISIAPSGDLFATVDSDAMVSVWSLEEHRRVVALNALWSFGGQRLHLTNSPKPLVITSSWSRGRAVAYDAITGENLWTVSIKHVQSIAPISYLGSSQLGFATDARGVQIRDVLTGAYLKNVAGIRKFFQSRHAPNCLLISRKKGIVFCAGADGPVLGESFLVGFAVLDAAHNSNEALLSEAGGPIRCFDPDGKERWRVCPPQKSHALRVCWSEDLNAWLVLMYQYDEPNVGVKSLAIVNERGMSELFPLPTHATFAIASDARTVIGGDGWVRAIPSGEIIWRFAEN